MGVRYDFGVSVKDRSHSSEVKEGVLILDGGDFIFVPATPCGMSSGDPDFTDRAKRMIERRKCRERMVQTARDELITIEGAYVVADDEVVQVKLKRRDRGLVRPGGYPGLVLRTQSEKYRFELIEKRDLPMLAKGLDEGFGGRFKE